MFNLRLKRIYTELSRELWRGSDEQIEEFYNLVNEEYNNRADLKKADLGSKK